MRIVLFLAALFGVAILAGCATLSQAECEAGDWRALGRADGANGYPASHVSNHMSACAEHGIAVDRQLYEAGRTEGLRAFCRLDNAVSRGRDGQSYSDVCAGEIGVSFRLVYNEARDVNWVDNALSTARSQLNTAISQIANPGAPDEQRQRLQLEIVRIQGEIVRLEGELRREEAQLRETLSRERARLQRLGIVA